MKLRIVFNISASGDTLKATMDSPDQGAKGIPVSSVEVEGDTVRFEVQAVRGYYEGVLDADSLKIAGEWHQSGLKIPLELGRTNEEVVVRRPQEPKKPYPYDEEEVEYPNEEAGIKLAGTLTTPKGEGPFPAVILISGSGPQDRNETLMGHKPFLVLADYLTRRGIAVLRFDDRGVGASTGNFADATTRDFAGDVRAGIDFLESRKDIDKKRIGLIGHSEGAIVAPMVAARSKDVAFIVLMAGTGMTGEEILYSQAAAILRASGVDEHLVMKNRMWQEAMFAIIEGTKDDSLAVRKLVEAMRDSTAGLSKAEKAALGVVEENLEAQAKSMVSPWFRFFLTYDPRSALKQVKCPVLALGGEKDLQVPAKENLGAIKQALVEGGNEKVTVVELPGLNHLFQTAETGVPAEYARIEETMSPTALERIGDWILGVVGE
jgi:hypothetical protein